MLLFFILAAISINASSYEYMNYRLVIDNSSNDSLPMDALKIYIKDSGLYRLTYSDFEKNGINASEIDFSKVALYNKGVSKPFMLIGYEDGQFNQGDLIVFFGERLAGEYTYRNNFSDFNCYFLYFNQAGVSDRIVKNSFAEINYPDYNVPITKKTHFEKDAAFEFYAHPMGAPTDFSFWLPIEWILNKNIRTVDFQLPGLDNNSTLPAEVKAYFYGRSEVYSSGKFSHNLAIAIQDTEIGKCQWNFATDYTFSNTNVSRSYFKEDANTIKFSLTDKTVDPDKIFLDWFEITYPIRPEAQSNSINFKTVKDKSKRIVKHSTTGFKDEEIFVFNTTRQEYILPTVLPDAGSKFKAVIFNNMDTENEYYMCGKTSLLIPTGTTPFISRDLRNPNNAADYIIVTHEDFLSQSQMLADYRAKDEFTPMVITTTQIYDEFYNGIPDVKAFREAFKYIYHNWSAPTLKYVLLMGDYSWDFYNIQNNTNQNFIPTKYIIFTKEDYASDIWMGDFDNNDYKPEICIGRLPVKTQQEADDIVYKLINYEMNNVEAYWRHKAVISASADFVDLGEELIAEHLVNKFYVDRLYVSPTMNTTQYIIDAVVSGTGLLAFIGHGGRYIWWTGTEKFAKSEKERFSNFTPESVDSCINPLMLPMVFGITCFNNNFDNPSPRNCIGEKFLLKRDGGAIACLGTSGYSLIENDKVFCTDLFSGFFTQKMQRIGDAFFYASQITTLNEDALMYILLGDPATPHPLLPLN